MDAVVEEKAVLAGCYKLERSLGQGGQARTYLARRVEDGSQVVVKELRVDGAQGWKPIELFEREAAVLEALEHPAIPAYVDSFEVEDGGSTRLYLVQEHIEGQDLAAAVSSGFHVDEAQAKNFARRILDVLDYLHAQSPPVVHRDIKPSNIIRGVDGEFYLVDFGAARQVLASARDGSTVVGSAGYVPPEQLHGGAVPASDLYALGATLVFLLTRRPPDELPAERMKLKFRQAANVSESFAAFLDRLLEPDVSKRLQSASAAKAALESSERQMTAQSGESGGLPAKYRGPRGTKIVVRRQPGELTAELPRRMRPEAWTTLLGAVGGAGWFLYKEGLREDLFQFTTAGVGLWAVLAIMLGTAFALYLKRTRLTLTEQGFAVEHDIAGIKWGSSVEIAQFVGLRQEKVRSGRHTTEPALVAPNGWDKEIAFGRGLSAEERSWLVELFGRGTKALQGAAGE